MENFKCSKVKGGIIGSAMLCSTIFAFEDKVNVVCLDAVGIPTVCIGHTGGIKLGQRLSDEECNVLFQDDAKTAINAINELVKVKISEHTAVALTSFVFNVGKENFRKSTLLKKLNSGDIVGACNELPKWSYARGKKLKGLANRREKERELCLTF